MLLESGANALQIYTALIYEGPGIIKEINDSLSNCFSKILNLIDAELNYGSKDYDKKFIRKQVEKLTS